MGKGSFYHRFTDKAALHDWVTERLSAALLDEVHPPQPDTLTAERFQHELRQFLARLGQVSVSQPELMDLGRMFHNSADAPPERAIARMRGTVTAWIADVLQTGRELGTIRADLPLDLLTGWTIATLTTLDQWVLGSCDDIDTRRTTADTMLTVFWRALTGETDTG